MSPVQLASAGAPQALIALWVLVGAAQTPPRSVETLLERLRSGPAPEGAACQLGRTKDPRVFSPLVDALESGPSIAVRACAASSLGDLEDPRAVDPLLRALDDREEQVRHLAALALGAYPEPRVVTRLIDMLQRGADSDMRASAAAGLARTQDPSAVEPLTRALREEKDDQLRPFFARALGAFSGEPAAADALMSQLTSDSDPWVRREAARSLGRLKDSRARGPLEKALEDTDPGVRKEAASALQRIGAHPRP